VEWGRLGKAIIEQGVKIVDPDYDAPGGSTLATQIEKYRHSPGGITASFNEKFRQMMSASLRAYANGTDTSERRRQIAVDYLNTFPLAAAPGHGEVNGLGDGLWAWYGADFESVNALLTRGTGDPAWDPHGQARALRQVLSLLIAQRRPSYFLGPGGNSLPRLPTGICGCWPAPTSFRPRCAMPPCRSRFHSGTKAPRSPACTPDPGKARTWSVRASLRFSRHRASTTSTVLT
jgi:hypothetical protein